MAERRCHESPSTFGWINSIWKCFYDIFPDDDVADDLAMNTSLVVGGEGCIWGEGTDGPSIESQVLTSASAIAENLWTGKGSRSVGDPSCPGRGMAGSNFISNTECRLGRHVCLMQVRVANESSQLGCRYYCCSSIPKLSQCLFR